MTEAELINEALAALGVVGFDDGAQDERVLDEFRRAIRAARKPVTCVAVARALEMKDSTVRAACVRLVGQGRMLAKPQGTSGKFWYIPTPEAK